MRTLLACGAVAGLALAAEASTVRFKYAGTITEVRGIPGPVVVGDDFTVAYNFDSTTPDSDPFPTTGNYINTIMLVEGGVGTHIVAYSAGDIFVLNNGFAGDSYSARAEGPNSFIQFNLTDLGGGELSDDSLPITLNISGWELKTFTIHVDIGPTFWEATGDITAFSSEILPDPCYPDCNEDTQLTVADFGCFQTRFVAGDMYADCNQDTQLTVSDFGCFQTAFVTGCP